VSIDFQVIFPQEVVNLSNVRVAPNLAVRTLDILGDDFTSVSQVLINKVQSPSVIILSKNRLLAQVPDQVLLQPIASVQVIASRLIVTAKSYIVFQIGNQPSKVRGILRLMQLFLKILFTTPGTDIFAPNTGAAALKNIGKTFGESQSGSIVSDFVVSVATAQKQIIAVQSRDSSIPRDERLMSAIVTTASYSQQSQGLVVSVELTSQAGRAAVANVVV
jgi:hypothetical protein